MNRRDWMQLQLYATKCLAALVIVLAITSIVSGGVSTIQLFNHPQQSSTAK